MKSTKDLPTDVIHILGEDDLSTQWTKTTSQYKDRLRGYMVPIIKIRSAYINTDIPTLVRRHLYIEMGSRASATLALFDLTAIIEAHTARLSVEPYDEYASVIFD